MVNYQDDNTSWKRFYCFEDEICFVIGMGIYTFAKRLVKISLDWVGKNNNKGEN